MKQNSLEMSGLNEGLLSDETGSGFRPFEICLSLRYPQRLRDKVSTMLRPLLFCKHMLAARKGSSLLVFNV